jgi:hypothetical protein
MWPFTRLRHRYHKLSNPSSNTEVRVHRAPVLSFVFAFFVVYLFLVLVVRFISRRDPTSLFFNPDLGYERRYSALRLKQADAFIAGGYEKEVPLVKFNDAEKENALCVGIATVSRGKDTRYFKSAVGSILEGLHPSERQRVFVILFVAHTEPRSHPAYAEAWMHELADQVLLYNSSTVDLDHIRWLESDKALMREKALFDYTYLLKACEAVGTPYIAMLEDDVIAMDGWFHRTISALSQVRKKIVEKRENIADCKNKSSSSHL